MEFRKLTNASCVAPALITLLVPQVSILHAKEPLSPYELAPMSILGSPDAIFNTPGSAQYIDFESLKQFSYADINQVLRKAPGVYLRPEDGYGLFPNISLRGVDTTRSAKVTLMEDGILAAPAPYAAPSAYYSPTMGRMNGLEVMKGSSQIRYGPQSTGGAINYLSTPIPEEERVYLRAQYGAYNDFRVHAVYGDTQETKYGNIGYVIEGYFRGADGFQKIDAAPGFNRSDDTGFTNIDPMIKLSWEPLTDIYQKFEFKYGYSNKGANASYLGLSTEDFNSDPYRRYSSSRFDNIEREQHRTYLRHTIAPADNFNLETTAYYSHFKRSWYKLNDLRNIGGGAHNLSLSSALAGGSGGVYQGDGLDCLKGTFDCGLRVRDNNRKYFAWGIQTQGTLSFDTDQLNHELTVGLRYHNDQESRFQHQDIYWQNSDGTIGDVTYGAPGSQADREDEAKAVALFIEDRIKIGDGWVAPGFRYEYVKMQRRDFKKGASGETSLNMFGGGLGGGYNFTDEWQAFGGIHVGFSPPSPGGAIKGIKPETSVAYEIGTRFSSSDNVYAAELVGFYTQFDDLIVVNNIGGTGSGDNDNFGKVGSGGIELSGQFDLGLANNWSFSNPYFLAFTYTNAKQQSSAQSTKATSIFSYGKKGNVVPYIPEVMVSGGTSLEFTSWGASLNVSYVSETFSSANNVDEELNGENKPDARFGKTDEYTIVDLEAHYNMREGIKVFAGVHNLFDANYVATRQPHGSRPGSPRIWYTGIEFDL